MNALSWYWTCKARFRAEGSRMISAEDAKMTRIIRLVAQILRALESAHAAALLKVFFNDNPLISAEKCGHSAGHVRAQRGLES
jgi:hypothetical protein